ncbi:hypothetical protein H2200_000836 [Cladophialophora chaetospira]|uniref:Secreted protein n=1 Tax=Cladophialophora chaetospira TaxID=386627 RepID=A0AA38XP79_9EURO|nr:hypothetical protein H2200_000836 [Cladophialophora chaetospira]
MKTAQAILLAAGILAPIASAAATAGTTNLGNVSFGSPACGTFVASVLTSDCDKAVTQILAAHCTGGVCSIPASPGAQESAINQASGTCQVLIGAFVNGGAATFNEGPVQSAFPGFISTCNQASENEKGSDGSSFLDSTGSSTLRLVFLTSNPQSSG